MAVVMPDLELFICEWLRSQVMDVTLLQVGNREPEDYDGSYPLVVCREIPGSQSGRVTFDCSLGVTVRGWARSNPRPCKLLAARVYGLLTEDPGILLGHADGSPILSIEEPGCVPASPVTEDSDVCRYYLTVEYTLSGSIQ